MQFKKAFISVTIFAIAVTSIFSQVSEPKFSTSIKENLEYGIFVPGLPNSTQKYPLVLYLHGYTDDPFNHFPWFQNSLQENEACFILMPKCPESWGAAAWGGTYDSELRSTTKTALNIIDSLLDVYPIDRRRIYVYGNSMGGEGVFALLAYRPGYFAAGIAVAGYTKIEMASAMKTTPLWIIHGSNDDLNPTSSSRNIFAAIKKEGGTLVRYSEYQGFDHYNIWSYVPTESDIVPWLLAQKKDSVFTNKQAKVQNLNLNPNSDGVILTWGLPKESKDLWYYSIYRNDTLLNTLRNDELAFTDNTAGKFQNSVYKVTATNYNFNESEPVIIKYVPVSVNNQKLQMSENEITMVFQENLILKVELTLVATGQYNLKLIDLQGITIDSVILDIKNPGKYFQHFNAKNLVAGTYIVSLNSAVVNCSRKIILNTN